MADFSLVIVAGGSGSRMRSATKKAFITLSGVSLLEHTVNAFRGIEGVAETVVVLPGEELAELAGRADSVIDLDTARPGADPLLQALAEAGVTRLARGGERRQDSVRNGLDATSAEIENVLVHDAARPFVPRAGVLELMAKVRETGAGHHPQSPPPRHA